MKILADRFTTRLGRMFCAVREDGAVVHLCFLDADDPEGSLARATAKLERDRHEVVWKRGACAAVRREVDEFLRGNRVKFDFELAVDGTEFQRAVWRTLRRVPYGKTVSYQALAVRVGRPTAVRAVARANATNPISLAVPCHRVIGADGSLTGFGGGLSVKRALLDLEAGVPSKSGRRSLAARR